jgi:hypothetical protein
MVTAVTPDRHMWGIVGTGVSVGAGAFRSCNGHFGSAM